MRDPAAYVRAVSAQLRARGCSLVPAPPKLGAHIACELDGVTNALWVRDMAAFDRWHVPAAWLVDACAWEWQRPASQAAYVVVRSVAETTRGIWVTSARGLLKHTLGLDVVPVPFERCVMLQHWIDARIKV